jgi:hypothetical protein
MTSAAQAHLVRASNPVWQTTTSPVPPTKRAKCEKQARDRYGKNKRK